MNGRALNDVERAYFWKETEELFDMYKANYHNLTIAKQEFREVEERLRREYEREIKALKTRIYELERKENEMKQIRDDLDELRKFVKEQVGKKQG
jgi:prefoldin subunit 5